MDGDTPFFGLVLKTKTFYHHGYHFLRYPLGKLTTCIEGVMSVGDDDFLYRCFDFSPNTSDVCQTWKDTMVVVLGTVCLASAKEFYPFNG